MYITPWIMLHVHVHVLCNWLCTYFLIDDPFLSSDPMWLSLFCPLILVLLPKPVVYKYVWRQKSGSITLDTHRLINHKCKLLKHDNKRTGMSGTDIFPDWITHMNLTRT